MSCVAEGLSTLSWSAYLKRMDICNDEKCCSNAVTVAAALRNHTPPIYEEVK